MPLLGRHVPFLCLYVLYVGICLIILLRTHSIENTFFVPLRPVSGHPPPSLGRARSFAVFQLPVSATRCPEVCFQCPVFGPVCVCVCVCVCLCVCVCVCVCVRACMCVCVYKRERERGTSTLFCCASISPSRSRFRASTSRFSASRPNSRSTMSRFWASTSCIWACSTRFSASSSWMRIL